MKTSLNTSIINSTNNVYKGEKRDSVNRQPSTIAYDDRYQ